MTFTLIRHATGIAQFAGTRFFIDPILYKKGALEPIKGGTDKRNPLVDIAVKDELLKSVDAILLTHTHGDHFDPDIARFFDKSIPIICATEYGKLLADLGFDNLYLIKDSISFNGVEIILTKGKHGKGVVGKLMGHSYGFVLKAQNDALYITGDTIWCKCVENAIEAHSPKHIIAFAGSAMINNQHITMDEKDISAMLIKAPDAKIIAIHMEAWNHCRLTRSALKSAIQSENLYIPSDGETVLIEKECD